MTTEGENKVLLVQPTGYRVLVSIMKVAEKTDGGIIRPDELRAREDGAQIIGYVVALGPDAYKDTRRFPSGPSCKEGDYVLFRSYAGTKFSMGTDTEFRLINDDTVEAVVMDPTKVRRAA